MRQNVSKANRFLVCAAATLLLVTGFTPLAAVDDRLGVSEASAQSPEVFLLPFPALGEGVGTAVVRRINENVQGQLRSLRVDFATEFVAEETRGPEAGVRQANAEYQRGIGLYVVQDFAAAITAFEAALQLYADNAGGIEDFRPVPDALFKLSEAHFRSGNEDMARVTLMRALALQPDTPAPDTAGQAYGRFFEGVLDARRRQGRGDLRITSSPAGLPAFVNGEEVGTTPVAVEELPVGDHYVWVRGESSEDRLGAVTSVQRGRDVEARLDLQRLRAERAEAGSEPRYLRSLRTEVARGTISDGLIPYMRELTTRQGFRYVVVGVIVNRDGVYEVLPFVYRASDGLFSEIEPQTYDGELSNISVHSYQQAATIQAALRDFPEDRLVTGRPIIAVPVAAPAPSPSTTPEPEQRGAMVVPTIEARTDPRRQRSAEPEPEPEPEPAPVAVAPVVTPPPQQAAPPQQQPAWGQPPQQAAPPQQQPAWGQPQQQPAWGQPQQQPAWGQPQQQPAWGQPQQQPAWGQPQQQGYGQSQQQGYGQQGYGQQGYGSGVSSGVQQDVRPDRERDRDSVFASPIFWGVVGGVVVAGTVTAIILATGGEGGVDPIITW